jgi:hypothetical protein
MGEVQTRPTGMIIPFPDPPFRVRPAVVGACEPRGQILFFTGIRYERQPEPSPSPSFSDGHGPNRRRRRS